MEERYKKDSIGGGEWRFLSGQKQYTAKMNKRMSSLCPQWRNLSSAKATDSAKLLKVLHTKNKWLCEINWKPLSFWSINGTRSRSRGNFARIRRSLLPMVMETRMALWGALHQSCTASFSEKCHNRAASLLLTTTRRPNSVHAVMKRWSSSRNI